MMKKIVLCLASVIITLHVFPQTKVAKASTASADAHHASGLSSFTARPLSDHVQVNWLTVNAIDNNFFTIERSADFVNFESINRINGSVKQSAILSYQIDDFAPFMGVSYYRLKLTDFDGKHTYSDIESVVFATPVNLQLLRNATSGNYILNFKTVKEKEDNYTVEISNALGESVYKEILTGFTGNYNREFDLLRYGKTAYLITISSSTEKIVKRVVAY
jgi:hypothetical protein